MGKCIVAIFSVVAIILFSLWASAQTKANNERAERIMANFPGKLMSRTENHSYRNNSNIYSFIYRISENGKCTGWEKTGWEKTDGARYSEDDYEYSVHISLTGKVTIQIGSSSYPLPVNNDDEPVSFGKGDDLYSIDSGFFNNDEPPVNNDEPPVNNDDEPPVYFESD